MGRGREFSPAENQLLLDNYDLTIVELEALLSKHGYNRSRKSINRKLEKMREENTIGLRSKDTVKRAYKQRNKKPEMTEGPSFESGPSFSGGFSGGKFSGGGWNDNTDS